MEEIKQGDLVLIMRKTRWGGILGTRKYGLALRRSYLAYHTKHTRWKVLVSDKGIVDISQNLIKKLDTSVT